LSKVSKTASGRGPEEIGLRQKIKKGGARGFSGRNTKVGGRRSEIKGKKKAKKRQGKEGKAQPGAL